MHQSTSYLMQPLTYYRGRSLSILATIGIQNGRWRPLWKNKTFVSHNCNTNAHIKLIIDTGIDDLEWKNSYRFWSKSESKMAAFPHFSPIFPIYSNFSPLFPTFHHFSPFFPTFHYFFQLLAIFPTVSHFSKLFPNFSHFLPLFPTLAT